MAKSPSLVLLDGGCDFSGSQRDVGLLVISFIFLVAFALIFVLWVSDLKSLGSVGKFPVFGFTVALVMAFLYPLFPPPRPDGHSALMLTETTLWRSRVSSSTTAPSSPTLRTVSRSGLSLRTAFRTLSISALSSFTSFPWSSN